MTVFLIFVFFGLLLMLLFGVFVLFCLVSERSRFSEISVCVIGLLIIAMPTLAVAWNIWQRITPS